MIGVTPPFAARAWRASLVASLVLLAAGCGRSGNRAGVHGTVTLAGSPLDQGVIEFYLPSLDGPAGGAAIVDGRYVVPRSHGLLPGDYRVVIRSMVERAPGDGVPSRPDVPPPAQVPAATKEPLFRDRIPAEFGDASKLAVSLEAGRDVAFDVAIP
jgi:hypothetical protein